MSMKVRRADTNDIDTLQQIGRQTFLETFSSGNTPENINRYVEESFSKPKLLSELNNVDSQFFILEHEAQVIGYLKVNTGQAQSDIKDHSALEIERIYVLREFHGLKAGQELFDTAITVARNLGVDYVWLGVWEENPRAINFYRKNGFVEFDRHVFRLGSDEQTDILMKLSLK